MIRRLIVPLTVAIVTLHAGQAFAQGAFPAPLPGKAGIGQRSGISAGEWQLRLRLPSAPRPPKVRFRPPVQRHFRARRWPAPPTQAGPADDCMKGFLPLREEAEKRGKLIKAASDRHAPPDEACKLIGNFAQSEIKMIKYVESHAAKCGIPPQIADQLKSGHKNTEAMQQKVCAVAEQMQKQGPAGPSLSEVLGSATALPEATATQEGRQPFDTLNGNVLTR